MTSPCIENSHLCTAKPSANNGVLGHDAEPRLPRIFGGADADRADRPHVKPVSEGYRYVTWYFLLLFVSVSTLVMVEPVGEILKDIFSTVVGPIPTAWLSAALSSLEVIMYRIKRGGLAALALSTCIVAGNEKVVVGTERIQNRTFDVFDYVDPLIGTINGGWLQTSYLQTVANNTSRTCFPWCNSSIW
jgi:hypothetical protein